ncbi:MAG TPA: hypothetical protein VNB22_20110 [Pyrinomonadaceae bacterium]|jgi:hypothetical protein|nr:hypothetical protein [Pyrinomonadaceae bacterium]
MTEETNEENPKIEKLESVGQIILGELEKLGGILTGDPISQAEGELTEDVGTVHLETAEELDEEETKDSEPTK